MFHFASLTTWLETWDTTVGMHNMGKGKRPKHFFQPKNLHLLQLILPVIWQPIISHTNFALFVCVSTVVMIIRDDVRGIYAYIQCTIARFADNYWEKCMKLISLSVRIYN